MIFLDFDGVLCDSIDECFVSSWVAHWTGSSVPASIRIADHSRFVRYRPFIRRGADYMLLQTCIERGVELNSQRDFDAELERAGDSKMEEYDRRFYEARKRLLESERRWWVALNRPYGGIVEGLRAVQSMPLVHIISTKRADYIAPILHSWGVQWPADRIFHSGTESKEQYILHTLQREGAQEALFVDDQIDHLVRLADARISGRLAVWGYVKPEWMADRRIEHIEREELIRLLARLEESSG